MSLFRLGSRRILGQLREDKGSIGETSIYEVFAIGMTEGLGEPLVEEDDIIELLSDLRQLLRRVKDVSELVPSD